jgi:hypothetical protein
MRIAGIEHLSTVFPREARGRTVKHLVQIRALRISRPPTEPLGQRAGCPRHRFAHSDSDHQS